MEEGAAWAAFAARLRAAVRARLPEPQALIAALSRLEGRGVPAPKAQAAEEADEDMPEAPDDDDAANTQDDVSLFAKHRGAIEAQRQRWAVCLRLTGSPARAERHGMALS